jgi:hypothetical protein
MGSIPSFFAPHHPPRRFRNLIHRMTDAVWVTPIRWTLLVALSALAGKLAVFHATPIDFALPLICGVLALAACASEPLLLVAVPLLVVFENVLPDAQLRLMAFGAVAAIVFAVGIAFGFPVAQGSDEARVTEFAIFARVRSLAFTAAALVLLRWIPFSEVRLLRELLVLLLALVLVEVLGRTPLAIAVGVVTAFVTPAIPLRTLALPIAVLVVALLLRVFRAPQVRLTWPASLIVGFVALFFPWSGIVARTLPFVLRPVQAQRERVTLNYALAPGVSRTIDVPPEATALIVSGANVGHLRRGVLLGRIEPGGIVVRIGDAADWGSFRRDHFYDSRNPLPHDAAGQIRDWGYSAWVDGAGRIALPRNARTITVAADRALPRDAALQVEAFELR